MQYCNPSVLPHGAVLVIGTGQSGAQIAEELYQSGRKVYLSIGSAGRVPRRYRGKDISDWFTRMGMFDTQVQTLNPQRKSSTQIHRSPGRTEARVSVYHGVHGLRTLKELARSYLTISKDLTQLGHSLRRQGSVCTASP
jgi:cation diffusion facilitator CzcD-associated flavoprotein CzcO